MAKKTFFITGATGLLGTELTRCLLETTDCNLRVLVRAKSVEEATYRLMALWWGDAVLSQAVGNRVVIPITGDVTRKDLGLDENTRRELLSDTTHIVHCAAETGVLKSKGELWSINVEGTRNVISLAEQCSAIERFTYISTAYVAGTQRGLIKEEPSMARDFNSLYEQSKAEAEEWVRRSSLPFTICRPGMIVGNSTTGRTCNFNTVYYVLKLMLQGKLRMLPVSRHQPVNVVPVDYVARQVATLALHPQAIGKTFHLLAPHNQLPHVGELISEVRKWAKENLLVSLPQPVCIPIPILRSIGKRYNSNNNAKHRNLLSSLTALMPYFFDDHQFDRTSTDLLTGEYHMDWRKFLPTLLSFACRHNFMRLTDKTIFEQAVDRRKSNHHPITYFDITASGIRQVTGKEMNSLVAYFIGQLKELGIKPGDRVAIAGINCCEHAAIDNAIGLVGATSVPIYYTTPAQEIALLIQKSGARCFFVGDERVKQNLDFINKEVHIVEFGPLRQAPLSLSEDAMNGGSVHLSEPQLSFITDTPATIRYTSGTTGEPKGVMFNVQQLKWMGEVLTNLLPWSDRNSEMRYLSFLPMSHVVEGILAAYAPYCMLCKAKIYYLNDFQMLASALPRVRPTVFFSVPRFYEKLWEQIEHNVLGKYYLRMADGLPKRLVATILRKAVLRKAGLDKCSQLLVGSAPISEELLHHFRALGVEIHNAYGQTEAPLISLNRLADNVIPSIGTPLPDTSVSLAPDGELLVRGPQVAMGYYQLESPTFSDGLLHTGDLGSIDDTGHIYIGGRKKDMLITSYGKNINCTKIEQRLCDIACVQQAVVVGEQKPFCTALLWTNSNTETIEADILLMNQSLSHPEQIKRWRIIQTPLSIKNGELTPNLKVKRQVVWSHYKQIIDEMYDNG